MFTDIQWSVKQGIGICGEEFLAVSIDDHACSTALTTSVYRCTCILCTSACLYSQCHSCECSTIATLHRLLHAWLQHKHIKLQWIICHMSKYTTWLPICVIHVIHSMCHTVYTDTSIIYYWVLIIKTLGGRGWPRGVVLYTCNQIPCN